MTQSKRGAARKGGASRASAPKTFKFRGVALERPKKIPDTLGFDLGEIALRGEEGNFTAVLGLTHRVLEEMLGREELAKVRAVTKGVNDPWQTELLNAVLDLHGYDMGEA